MTDYSKLTDFEINKLVCIALGIEEHVFIPDCDEDFDQDIPVKERGPVWQTNKTYVRGFLASNGNCFNPCNKPDDAWHLFFNYRIGLNFVNGKWRAQSFTRGYDEYSDDNPLRAVAIVFLKISEAN
ncbi:DUF2591 family protein (plasmid) [Escherichia coli]|nr:DUF2591 family protein [Escherichia coli]MBA8354074.1 DUF2591 family protein [Escherichia coli]